LHLSATDPLPVALAFQHVESFFLNTMNVEASGKPGWQRPVEHRRVLGIFSGYEERQRLAGQCDSFGFARHSNNSFWAHMVRTIIPPSAKVLNLFRNYCEIFPKGAYLGRKKP
jgi:hypothetical protein